MDETADGRRGTEHRDPEGGPGERFRDEDLEPHEGLRYVARLFKVLAVLLLILLAGEIAAGIALQGREAAVFLVVEATRLIVFAGFLWGAGDIALLLIDSNHDLRATRIMVTRLLHRLESPGGGGPPGS